MGSTKNKKNDTGLSGIKNAHNRKKKEISAINVDKVRNHQQHIREYSEGSADLKKNEKRISKNGFTSIAYSPLLPFSSSSSFLKNDQKHVNNEEDEEEVHDDNLSTLTVVSVRTSSSTISTKSDDCIHHRPHHKRLHSGLNDKHFSIEEVVQSNHLYQPTSVSVVSRRSSSHDSLTTTTTTASAASSSFSSSEGVAKGRKKRENESSLFVSAERREGAVNHDHFLPGSTNRWRKDRNQTINEVIQETTSSSGTQEYYW
jgi:hypothetical protein